MIGDKKKVKVTIIRGRVTRGSSLRFEYRQSCFVVCEGAAEPVGAAGFAYLVSPHVIAYVKPFIFFYPFTADIAIILLEFVKERFGVIERFFLCWHGFSSVRSIPEPISECKKISGKRRKAKGERLTDKRNNAYRSKKA